MNFNPQAIMGHITKMFPDNEDVINQAINQATQATQGANENQAGEIARKFGITPDGLEQLYNKYAKDPRATMALRFLGTSPERLKNDALNILNMSENNNRNTNASTERKSSNTSKFPYLNAPSNKPTEAKTSTGNIRFPRLK